MNKNARQTIHSPSGNLITISGPWALLLIWAAFSFAQEKIAPPPSQITLPSDSTRVELREKNKVQAKEPQLDLPEVLILGQDRAKRELEDTKTLIEQSPAVLKPSSPYEPVPIWFQHDEFKPEVDRGIKDLTQINWLSLQGGGFSTFLMEGGRWQRLAVGDYRVNGWYQRSNGQFPNNKWSQGGFSGKLKYELAPQVSGIVYGNYDMYRRGLQTTAFLKKAIRGASKGGFGAELQYDINKLSDGRVGFLINSMNVSTDTLAKRVDESDDFWYKLYFTYSALYKKIQFSGNGRFVHDSFQTSQDSVAIKSSLGEIGVEALTSLSQTLSSAIGIYFQSSQADSFVTKNRFSPYGKINYMPNDRFGITFQGNTGYQLHTFSEWWSENPYIAHRIPQQSQETRFALRIDSDFQLLPTLKLRAGIARSWIDRMFYWQAHPDTRLIQLEVLQNPELTEMQIGFIADLSSKTRLQAFFISYSDKIDTTTILTKLNRIPYRPDYRLPIRASIQLLKDMSITLQADINGPRRSKYLRDNRLPAFALFNVALNKDFGAHFSGLFSVSNLLDSDYVIWEDYREMGIHLLAGLRARF